MSLVKSRGFFQNSSGKLIKTTPVKMRTMPKKSVIEKTSFSQKMLKMVEKTHSLRPSKDAMVGPTIFWLKEEIGRAHV